MSVRQLKRASRAADSQLMESSSLRQSPYNAYFFAGLSLVFGSLLAHKGYSMSASLGVTAALVALGAAGAFWAQARNLASILEWNNNGLSIPSYDLVVPWEEIRSWKLSSALQPSPSITLELSNLEHVTERIRFCNAKHRLTRCVLSNNALEIGLHDAPGGSREVLEQLFASFGLPQSE